MDSLAKQTDRKFWGWGYADFCLTAAESAAIEEAGGLLAPEGGTPISIPQLADYTLPKPRISPPDHLKPLLSATPYDRLFHAYGQSCADILRMLMRDAPNPPDFVAFPKTQNDICQLLEWMEKDNIAAIPFGGGTSVCGGVEPDVGDTYNGAVSIDLQYLDKVLEIDPISRAAHFEAGIFGPDLENALRPHGLTLRHFPQSFGFSTLGGWIATRAGGHFATQYTHIDDLVESIAMQTPRGPLSSRRLPGSGAGISADRMMLGSEGTMGIITDAWVRLQARPHYKKSISVRFDSFFKAADAVRTLSQSGLHPSNCRVLDPMEALQNGVGNGKHAVLLLGFESADHPLDAWMDRALALVADHGGTYDGEALKEHPPSAPDGETRDKATGAWRNAFIRMPYYRDEYLRRGLLFDTFETAITWDRFEEFHNHISQSVHQAISEITGRPGYLSCRFTHIYPDGPAPYYTFGAYGAAPDDLGSALQRWRQIKTAASEAIIAMGGTITHHHAVGRDHRKGYEQQSSTLFRQALGGMKRTLDPTGILNPGVLIDPVDRSVGHTGILGG